MKFTLKNTLKKYEEYFEKVFKLYQVYVLWGRRKKFNKFHLEMEKIKDREGTKVQSRVVKKTQDSWVLPWCLSLLLFSVFVELVLESHKIKNSWVLTTGLLGLKVCLDFWKGNFHVKIYFVFLFSDFWVQVWYLCCLPTRDEHVVLFLITLWIRPWLASKDKRSHMSVLT